MTPLAEIHFELELASSIDRVWKQLTTQKGITSFFSPIANIDFRVDGLFEIIFDPSAPIGEQGAEGMRILTMDKPNLFGFTWNSPPSIPKIRGQRTAVFIYLDSISETKTKLTFINSGYGLSPEWQESRNYFLNAWGNVVLPRLKYSLENGPIDWEYMPDLTKYKLYNP